MKGDLGQNQNHAEDRMSCDQEDELSFAAYLSEIQATLHELAVPGLFSSRRDVDHLERLYDAGADLDVVIRGIERGFSRKISQGKDVRGVGDLMATIRAELRRTGVVDE